MPHGLVPCWQTALAPTNAEERALLCKTCGFGKPEGVPAAPPEGQGLLRGQLCLGGRQEEAGRAEGSSSSLCSCHICF